MSCPSPGDLPGPGIEPESPALAGRLFTTQSPGKSHIDIYVYPIGPVSVGNSITLGKLTMFLFGSFSMFGH